MCLRNRAVRCIISRGSTQGKSGEGRTMRFLLLALSLPLAGCFSVTGPKPVPEWAMNPQGGEAYAEPQPQRRSAVRQRAPEVARETADPAVGLAAAPADNRMTDARPNGVRPSNTQ